MGATLNILSWNARVDQSKEQSWAPLTTTQKEIRQQFENKYTLPDHKKHHQM